MKSQNENEAAQASTGEMTNEELDQVTGGNIFSSIAATSAFRTKVQQAAEQVTYDRSKTVGGPLYHYLID